MNLSIYVAAAAAAAAAAVVVNECTYMYTSFVISYNIKVRNTKMGLFAYATSVA